MSTINIVPNYADTQAAVVEPPTLLQEQPMDPETLAIQRELEELEAAERANRVKPNKLISAAMVVLDLTCRQIFENNSSALKKVVLDGKSYNLYSPFKKSKPEEGIPEGIARSAVIKIVESLNTVNTSQVMFLGNSEQVQESLEGYLDTLITSSQKSLPVLPTKEVAKLGNEEEDTVINIQMKDIVKVSGWINRQELEEIINNFLVLNITINSGSVYDSEDPVKTIKFIQGILNKIVAINDQTVILFGVILSASDLSNKRYRDILNKLIEEDEMQFSLFSKKDMLSQDELNWCPQDNRILENDLLAGGDILLLKNVVNN